MEINEQGNYELNRESEHDKFAELKEQITADARADVEAYINSIGGTIVPTGYNGAKDVARLVDKYNQLKVERDNEIERINNRYKESIAESKIKIVEENFKYDVKDLEDELDRCQAKDTFERERAIAELQNSQEYKEARKGCFDTLKLLENVDIPLDMTMEFINPLAEAKDVSSLKIAQLLVGADTLNGELIGRTIDTINKASTNSDIKDFVAEAKKYFATGEAGLYMFSMMDRYGRK